MFPSLTSVTLEIETKAVMRPRRISILGATGSIGESTLDLIGRNPSAYQVVGIMPAVLPSSPACIGPSSR